MPQNFADIQSAPQNGNGKLVQAPACHRAHGKDLNKFEEFQGPGFRFVQSFLLLILALVGGLVAIAAFLSWHFSMDVTVEGKGVIEPVYRHRVKVPVTGIIQQIYVRAGDKIEQGDVLATIDDTDWRVELAKLEVDLRVNQSQIKELEWQMEWERQVREGEVIQAQLKLDAARLQLENVVAEQRIYSQAAINNGRTPLPRKPLEELLPVRQAQALVVQSESNLRLVEKRLAGVDGYRQEIETLRTSRERLVQQRYLLETQLAKTDIRALSAGTVLTDGIENRQGDRLQVGEVLLEIAELGEWQARIIVQEIDIPKVEVGQSVKLYLNAFPHMEYRVFEGKVTHVPEAPMADMTGHETIVYMIKASVRNPEVQDGERIYSLAAGMSADAKISLERGRVAILLWKKLLRTAGKL